MFLSIQVLSLSLCTDIMAPKIAMKSIKKVDSSDALSAHRLFITYSNIPVSNFVDKESLVQSILDHYEESGLLYEGAKIAVEKHQSGAYHVHCLWFKPRKTWKKPLLKIASLTSSLNVKFVVTQCHWQRLVKYLDKEDTSPYCFGNIQWQTAGRKKDDIDIAFTNAMEIACKPGGEQEAFQLVAAASPRDALLYGPHIRRELQTLNKRPVFEPPPSILPLGWGQNLLNRLLVPPKIRKIHWWVGPPQTGKSTFIQYIVDNYEYGVCCMGSAASVSRCVHKYNGEGVVVWDFPLAFDWGHMSGAVSTTLEAFSNYGSMLVSDMYHGKVIKCRSC